MNKPLYLVCSKSFTGKDYIVDKMCKDFNMSKVISKTTRKPRYTGENTHVFVTKEQALKELPNSLADTYFDDNYYYTDLESINNKDFYIIDPNGIENFKYNLIKDRGVISCCIDCDFWTRLKHSIKRKDGIIKTIKRFINDIKEFRKVSVYDFTLWFNDTQEFYDYIKETRGE